MLIEDIKKHILLENYIITFHAHRRMDERGIYTDDLVSSIVMRWLRCARTTCV